MKSKLLPLVLLPLLMGAYLPKPVTTDATDVSASTDYPCNDGVLQFRNGLARWVNFPNRCRRWGLEWTYAGAKTSGDGVTSSDVFTMTAQPFWQPYLGDTRNSTVAATAAWNADITDLPTGADEYSPWRLPTIKELVSVFEYDYHSLDRSTNTFISQDQGFENIIHGWLYYLLYSGGSAITSSNDYIISSTAVDTDQLNNDVYGIYAIKVLDGSIHVLASTAMGTNPETFEYRYCGLASSNDADCSSVTDDQNVYALLVRGLP